ncbi:LTA synthase family protein [Castellaniella caeni]|uniref:LTA synthase family protein n=1 Tax=Castellaniella caeni TaxID=266123 RepID=UPI00083051F6|nr:LTA synthase family protein [Castellaniella caeni]
MALDFEFGSVWAALAVGLLLSTGIERLMTPRPPLQRAWAAWALHAGLWCLVYAALAALLARPWFAAAVALAFLLVLVLVNNAKFVSLREPFIFQDYDYFTDAIRHPRLYIPFLGWGKFALCALGVLLAIGVGFWAEDGPDERWSFSGHLGGWSSALVCGLGLLAAGAHGVGAVSFKPEIDLARLGFLAYLWCYAAAGRVRATVASPFAQLPAPGVARAARAVRTPHAQGAASARLPHLLAVQSESFFDPRPLVPGIRPDVLGQFDLLCAQARSTGQMVVPAWGANTIRTEFAFLSGIQPSRLGVRRFNAYRAIAANWRVASLASWLKNLGYRTVCIHPYPARFYQRDRVYPALGFDAFMDIQAFKGVVHAGPYMDDTAVASKMMAVLAQSSQPTFVMAITMENHGPLHLEHVAPGDVEALYAQPPLAGCDDLTIYLRHLRNADQMAATLRESLQRLGHPASLCWYGDHVPIMPGVYQAYGMPAGTVPYVCWNNDELGGAGSAAVREDIRAADLSQRWLRCAGLV